MRGGPFIGLDVITELLANARAQHLDRDIPAIQRHRAMNLRDRGRANCNFLDGSEQRLNRFAKAGFDLALDCCKGHRRQAVLQQQQVCRCFLADDVGAGCQGLPQLDRRRTDGLKRPGVVRHLGLERAQPGNAD